MNMAEAKRVLETALICSQQPLTLRDMRVLFDDALGTDSVKILLEELGIDWAAKGVELVTVATGWRFPRSRPGIRGQPWRRWLSLPTDSPLHGVIWRIFAASPSVPC